MNSLFSKHTLSPPSNKTSPVLLGIDILESNEFRILHKERIQKIGLLTNQTGVNRNGRSTIDILFNSKHCQLMCLFAPEHGIDGLKKANEKIDHTRHSPTNLQIYSLYGTHKKPSPEMLKNLDAIVIDLQDIGVRSYTYITCMRYVMESCFENNVAVVILDRPNPLSGIKIDGPILDKQWMSYVGPYEIPYVYGLTVGELALMAKNEPGWLQLPDNLRKKGKLIIVPMQGWSRHMTWVDTGLKWIPTSPRIPNVPAVFGYAMTGLGCEIGGFKHSFKDHYHFRVISHSNISPQELLSLLKDKHIPGLDFKLVTQPHTQEKGVYIDIKDFNSWNPTELSFHLMQLSNKIQNKNVFQNLKPEDSRRFNIHVGSQKWFDELKHYGPHARVNLFINDFKRSSLTFHNKSKKYWLYPN